MTQDKQLEAVDLKCQEILLELGILKTDDGIIYHSYVVNAHIENIVAAMKKYAAQFQHPQQPISIKAIEKMADEDISKDKVLVFVQHFSWQQLFDYGREKFIKGFTSALEYSAGDKK